MRTAEEYHRMFDDLGLSTKPLGMLAREATIKKLEEVDAKGGFEEAHIECMAGTYFDGYLDALRFFNERVHAYIGFDITGQSENPHRSRQMVNAGPPA